MNEPSGNAVPGGAMPDGTPQVGGVGRWLYGVIVEPTATFEEIAGSVERPHPRDPSRTKDGTKWWIPFLISIVVGALTVAVATSYEIPKHTAEIREAIEAQGGGEAEIEQAIQMAKIVGPIVAGVFLGAVMVGLFFAVAGLVHGFSKLMGGKGRFRVARAVAAYASVITTLGGIIKLPLMLTRKTSYIEIGPSLLFKGLEPSDRLFRFLMQLDVFMILWVVLLVFGIGAGYRIARGKAAVPAVIAWLLYALVAVFAPAGG